MSVGSSGREPDRQATEAASAASSKWIREGLGDGWVEIAPGIFQQVPRDEPAAPIRPAAREEVKSLEKKRREALEALQVDMGKTETAEQVRSSNTAGGDVVVQSAFG